MWGRHFWLRLHRIRVFCRFWLRFSLLLDELGSLHPQIPLFKIIFVKLIQCANLQVRASYWIEYRSFHRLQDVPVVGSISSDQVMGGEVLFEEVRLGHTRRIHLAADQTVVFTTLKGVLAHSAEDSILVGTYSVYRSVHRRLRDVYRVVVGRIVLVIKECWSPLLRR